MKHKPPFGFGSQRNNNQGNQSDQDGEFAARFVTAVTLLIDRVDVLEKRVSALLDKLEQAEKTPEKKPENKSEKTPEKKPEVANAVNLVDGGFNY